MYHLHGLSEKKNVIAKHAKVAAQCARASKCVGSELHIICIMATEKTDNYTILSQ